MSLQTKPTNSNHARTPVVPLDVAHSSSTTETTDPFQAQEFSAEDAAYTGSRFSQLRAALFAKGYQRLWGAPGEPALPMYDVRLSYLLRGALAGARRHLFRQAVARTVDSHADLRWGADQRGFRRIVHPMGVALFGRWEITEPSPYSGYFAKGARALIVGRYSVCCSEPRRGHIRSLSLAGKLYPTTDPNHAEPLRTANFVTQQDIGGESTEYINDVEFRNAPDTTGLRRRFEVATLFITGLVFAIVDKRPTIRQLYSVAELGKPGSVPTSAPEFMRLTVAADAPRVPGAALDFRDEVMAQIYDRGVAEPQRKLVFDIEVSDEGEAHGPLLMQRRDIRNWRRIGRISFDEACCSYNTDFVLHYNHPTWRADRNDPATATRKHREKVQGGHWLTEILLGSKAP
jgi:hypothetical protein